MIEKFMLSLAIIGALKYFYVISMNNKATTNTVAISQLGSYKNLINGS